MTTQTPVYNKVERAAMRVVGLSQRLKETPQGVSEKLGQMWNRFLGEGLCQQVEGKVSESMVCLCYDYEMPQDDKFSFTVLVGVPVSDDAPLPEGFSEYRIPAGSFAHLESKGPQPQTVIKTWTEDACQLMDIRSCTVDFEEYLPGYDHAAPDACVHVYLALK